MGSPEPPAPYAVEPMHAGLQFQNPVDLVFLSELGRWFVLEQGGKLWSFAGGSGVAKPTEIMDLRRHHHPFDTALGMTFHPGFATNHLVYFNYNEPGGRTNGAFVSEFRMDSAKPDAPRVDPDSERVILRWLSGGHNGCCLKFGPDGCLYISTGDAGPPDPPDPLRTGQELSDLLSSILRVDVDHPVAGRAYRVPPDNPFLGIAGVRPEIWAFGFRNPWRMHFGPDGALWVGDVGWELWEMVCKVRSGQNYGWSLVEGPNPAVRSDVTAGPAPIVPPLKAHPHSEGASITGGLVYRGSRLSGLRGAYVYGDYETGKLWALREEDGRVTWSQELADTTLRVIAFAEDAAQELVVLDYQGGLHRLVPREGSVGTRLFPTKLSETGLFTKLETAEPSPGVVTYDINASMWQDGAQAQRWVGIPGDGRIRLGEDRSFPTNTVIAKTLTLELDPGKPESRRRVETQLLHFGEEGWRAYAYRWNADQTDAALVPAEGAQEVFKVRDTMAPGGWREVLWRFASRTECLRCHNPWSGNALAFNFEQLNTSEDAAQNGIRRLERAGVVKLRRPPSPWPRLADLHDVKAAPANRARAWLHANCAHCHRSGAGGSVATLLNHELDLKGLRAVDEKPLRGDFGIDHARVIAAADPYRSTLFYRISTEGAGHMPLIGARTVDPLGLQLVRAWIGELPKAEPGPEADAPSGGSPGTTRWDGRNASQAIAHWMQLGSESRDGLKGEARAWFESSSRALALQSELESCSSLWLRDLVAGEARSSTNMFVRALFERFLPPDQRRRTLGVDFNPASVLALQGNAGRGRALFMQDTGSQCSRCHRIGEAGRAWGPDLSQIGRKYDRAQLLEHLVQPSKSIAPEFVTWHVGTFDGREWSGFLIRRDTQRLILRDEQLQEVSVVTTDVRTQQASALSAMPEGLLASLTAQEAADLLEFLASWR